LVSAKPPHPRRRAERAATQDIVFKEKKKKQQKKKKKTAAERITGSHRKGHRQYQTECCRITAIRGAGGPQPEERSNRCARHKPESRRLLAQRCRDRPGRRLGVKKFVRPRSCARQHHRGQTQATTKFHPGHPCRSRRDYTIFGLSACGSSSTKAHGRAPSISRVVPAGCAAAPRPRMVPRVGGPAAAPCNSLEISAKIYLIERRTAGGCGSSFAREKNSSSSAAPTAADGRKGADIVFAVQPPTQYVDELRLSPAFPAQRTGEVRDASAT